MTTSTSNALAVIDGAKSTDEIARLLPPLARTQIEFDRDERRAGAQNDGRRVGIYANAVAVLEGVRGYAHLRYDLLDGTTSSQYADMRLNNWRRSALAPAQRIEDEFSGIAQQNDKAMRDRMSDMIAQDAYRKQTR